MADKQTCHQCGSTTDERVHFCGLCGKPLGNEFCPKCGASVVQGIFCCKCGTDMKEKSAEHEFGGKAWSRGEEDFAVSVPQEIIRRSADAGFEIRHGCKALIFVDGRLEEIAESGRYPVGEGGFLSRIFKKVQTSQLCSWTPAMFGLILRYRA